MNTELITNPGRKPIMVCKELPPGWTLLGYWYCAILDNIYAFYKDPQGFTYRASNLQYAVGVMRLDLDGIDLWTDAELLAYLITGMVK